MGRIHSDDIEVFGISEPLKFMTEEALINAYLAHQHERAKKYLIVDDLCKELKMDELEEIDE